MARWRRNQSAVVCQEDDLCNRPDGSSATHPGLASEHEDDLGNRPDGSSATHPGLASEHEELAKYGQEHVESLEVECCQAAVQEPDMLPQTSKAEFYFQAESRRQILASPCASRPDSASTANIEEKQITRWQKSRVCREILELTDNQLDDQLTACSSCPDANVPAHAQSKSTALLAEDDMLHRALQKSLGLSVCVDTAFDSKSAGLRDWSPDEACDDYALSVALEASLQEQDLAEAKKSWAEAAKVPDSHPMPRSRLKPSGSDSLAGSAGSRDQAGLSGALVSQDLILAAATTAQGRNLRRSRKRAEQRGDVQLPSKGSGGCVVLVREDCRLHDNPALHCAAQEYAWAVLVYIHDDEDPSPWPVRGAGLWWRHASLQHFDSSLRRLGNQLVFRKGSYVSEVVHALLEVEASALLFNRQLEPWHHRRDLELQRVVTECLGIEVRSFRGMVLSFEPWEIRDRERARSQVEHCAPTVTGTIQGPSHGWPHSLSLSELGYGRTAGRRIPPGFRQFNPQRQMILEGISCLPDKKYKPHLFDPSLDDWAYEMRSFWKIGEEAAIARLDEWIIDAAWGCYYPPDTNPKDSVGGRFRADRKWTAILSPYLRFGDLSPRFVYWRCREALPHEFSRLFLKRVFLRDKAYSQLYKWPDSHTKSIRPQYENQQWSGTRAQLRRWQRGETGFPLVDAAMRQLWKVGWICNHLRHVTAQFLIEHLDLSWRDGFAWYDYTLVDTDVAINAMMWQMGGHSGIGSWNFVMHPIYAGKKVDPEGAYVRRWVPELAGLPVEYIHTPWEAPMHTQLAGSVFVNDIYWQRVIQDLVAARLVHQRNVIALRKQFPEFVKDNGNEIIVLESGEVISVNVRDDIRENDPNKITLMMTPDDPRSNTRRKLVSKNGVHTSLIFDESKKFEAMYDF